MIRGEDGKIYEVLSDNTKRELSHIGHPKYSSSSKPVFSIRDARFPLPLQASQDADAKKSEDQTPTATQSEDSGEAARQSEDSGEAAKATLYLVYHNSALSEEQVPEEVKINQLPNSKPLKLLPPPKFNPLNDKPSNNPETVTCCCNLFQMFCGALK